MYFIPLFKASIITSNVIYEHRPWKLTLEMQGILYQEVLPYTQPYTNKWHSTLSRSSHIKFGNWDENKEKKMK